MLVLAVPATAGAQGPGPGPYVLGDSVILGARDALLARLPGTTVDAHEGLSTLGAPEVVRAAPAVGPLVVVHLGHNDGPDPAAFAARIDGVMAALEESGTVERVLWLTQGELDPGRAGMNAELRRAVERWPELRVVDWHPVVEATPGATYADGLHLTPTGAEALAELVLSALEAAAPGPAPTAPTATPFPTSTADPTPATTDPGRPADAERAALPAGSVAAPGPLPGRTGGPGDPSSTGPATGAAVAAVAAALALGARPSGRSGEPHV